MTEELSNITEDKKIENASVQLGILVKLFNDLNKDIRKAIKKNDLQDSLLVKYYSVVQGLKHFIKDQKNVDRFLKENTKQKQKHIDSLKDDMLKQEKWCLQQFEFRNELRLKTNIEVLDYKKQTQDLIDSWNKGGIK